MKKQQVGLIPKILLTLGMLIIFGLGIFYFIEAANGQQSFFTKHFFIPIILLIIGCIAIYLPYVSSKSYSGDTKGDKLMLGVVLVLIFCSILSLVLSFA